MSKIEINCKNYTNFQILGMGTIGTVYKAEKKILNIMLQLKKLIKKNIINQRMKY